MCQIHTGALTFVSYIVKFQEQALASMYRRYKLHPNRDINPRPIGKYRLSLMPRILSEKPRNTRSGREGVFRPVRLAVLDVKAVERSDV